MVCSECDRTDRKAGTDSASDVSSTYRGSLVHVEVQVRKCSLGSLQSHHLSQVGRNVNIVEKFLTVHLTCIQGLLMQPGADQ